MLFRSGLVLDRTTRVDMISGWYRQPDGTQVILDKGYRVGNGIPQRYVTLRNKLQRLEPGMSIEQARELLGPLQQHGIQEHVADLGRHGMLTLDFVDGRMLRARGLLSLNRGTKVAVDVKMIEN